MSVSSVFKTVTSKAFGCELLGFGSAILLTMIVDKIDDHIATDIRGFNDKMWNITAPLFTLGGLAYSCSKRIDSWSLSSTTLAQLDKYTLGLAGCAALISVYQRQTTGQEGSQERKKEVGNFSFKLPLYLLSATAISEFGQAVMSR